MNTTPSTTFKPSIENLSIARAVFNAMTREQLRALAKRTNIKRGRNRKDTTDNLILALSNQQFQFRAQVAVFTAPEPSGEFVPLHGNVIYMHKFRTYKAEKSLVALPVEAPKVKAPVTDAIPEVNVSAPAPAPEENFKLQETAEQPISVSG